MPRLSYTYSLVALVLLLIAGLWWQSRAAVQYQSMFAETGVDETIYIDGISYRVLSTTVYLNGIALAHPPRGALLLAYESAAARYAPILGLPDTGLPTFRFALGKLAESEQALAAHQQTAAQAQVVNSLYPLDFLAALVAQEEARRAFLAHPTPEHARQYTSLIRATLASYLRDLEAFERGFSIAVPHDVVDYISGRNHMSRQAFLQGIDALANTAKQAARTLDRREQCARGLWYACNLDDLRPPVLEAPQSTKISAKSFALAQEIRSLYQKAGLPVDLSHMTALSQSACTPKTPLFASYTTSRGENGDTMTNPLYIGDIRFVASTQYADVPYFDFFIKHDISYLPLSEFTYYKCPEVHRDFSALAWTESVRKLAVQHPLSATVAASTTARLKELERALAGPVAYEEDAVAYISEALAYGVQGLFSRASVDDLNERALSYLYASAGYENSLLSVANTEGINTRLAAIGLDPDLEVSYLFYVRNGMALLFAADNPSLLGKQPLFPPDTLLPSQGPYLYYADIAGDQPKKELLFRGIQLFHMLHSQI